MDNKLLIVTEFPVISNQLWRGNDENHVDVLADIYQEKTNIAVWKRSLTDKLLKASKSVLSTNPDLEISLIVSPQDTISVLQARLDSSKMVMILIEDIHKLVNMFCDLFDLRRVGLRLTSLKHAMCPRFHVDNVPCRLITTYQGIATEWLPHSDADRSKLGIGNKGKPDSQSGIYQDESDVQQLSQGDVDLLKGEAWVGNEGKGLIHRSPQLYEQSSRLILTIDFIDD
jgi:hypothetical protein